MMEQPCPICGRLTVPLPEREGRCRSCLRHWYRHGVDQVAGPQQPCAACGRLVQKLAGGWYNTCYRFWLRTG